MISGLGVADEQGLIHFAQPQAELRRAVLRQPVSYDERAPAALIRLDTPCRG